MDTGLYREKRLFIPFAQTNSIKLIFSFPTRFYPYLKNYEIKLFKQVYIFNYKAFMSCQDKMIFLYFLLLLFVFCNTYFLSLFVISNFSLNYKEL